jgi:hypothetical protein
MLQLSPEILEENRRRNTALMSPYDPLRGTGSLIPRVSVKFGIYGEYFLPEAMAKIPIIQKAIQYKNLYQWLRNSKQTSRLSELVNYILKIRLEYDFEYWAATCIEIMSKPTPENPESVPIKFVLNFAQRKLISVLEKMRLEDKPIRYVLLKSRQWGGSTLTQIYMMWIQQIHKLNWNAAVIAQDDSAAMNVREMYSHAAREYPKEIGSVTLKRYANSSKNFKCEESGGIIGVGSVQNPDQFRSYKYEMVHMTEVASWGETAFKSSRSLGQSILGSIPRVPLSFIAIESTAKGVGGYFHNKWLDAKNKKSDYAPVFIPWWIIEMYQKPILDYEKWFKELSLGFKKKDEAKIVCDYADYLWQIGASLESINWYFDYKQTENHDDQFMFEEFPSNSEEAFISSGRRAFDMFYVNNARKHCTKPEYLCEVEADSQKGKQSLIGIRLRKVENGLMRVWDEPDKSLPIINRYLVVCDIGGKWRNADYSVITVLDRYWLAYGGGEKIVAEWRGHLDQDLVSWKAAQIASLYDNALLVVERNSLKVKDVDTEGDHSMTVLDEIANFYPNLYARVDPDKLKDGMPLKYGFFTGKLTKPMVIDALNAALRDDDYEESDEEACDEMDNYEIKHDGTYGAKLGLKDDRVMTRAIGLHISRSFMQLPKEIYKSTTQKKKPISEASF